MMMNIGQETFARPSKPGAALQAAVKETEATLRRDLVELKVSLIRWIAVLLFLQALLIVALVKLV